MGLVVISYTIKDISDPSGYLKSYGAKAIAAVKREERIKTAEAECRSRIKGYEAEMEKEKSPCIVNEFNYFPNYKTMNMFQPSFLLSKSLISRLIINHDLTMNEPAYSIL